MSRQLAFFGGQFMRRRTSDPLAAYVANGATPPLVLDPVGDVYAVDQSLVTYLSEAMSATRSAIGSLINSGGTEVNGAHNLLSGADFSTGWTVFGVTDSGQVDGPITASARSYTFANTLLSAKSVYRSSALAGSAARTRGIVISDVSGITHAFLGDNNASVGCWFNVASGTKGTSVGLTGGSATIEDLGGGAYYLEVTTPAGATGGGQFALFLSDRENVVWSTAPSGTESFTLDAPRHFLPGTSGMVTNPERSDTFVPTTSAAVYLYRLGHHVDVSGEWVNVGVRTDSSDSLTIPAANIPGYFFAMHGRLTYADNDAAEEQVLFSREVDANNLMKVTLDTSGTKTGTITLTVINGGVTETISSTASLAPGTEVSVRAAFGVTATELALSLGGSAETRVASPGVPDLSAADVDLPLVGALSLLAGYTSDIGDAGLEEASSAGFFNLVPAAYDAQINHVITYGQSLSIGQATPVQSSTAAYDSLMFTRGMRPQYDYQGETAAQWYAALVPAVEIASPNPTYSATLAETPTRGTLDSIKERISAEDGLNYTDHRYQLLGSNPGFGASTIAQISQGTTHYNRMVEQVTYGKALASAAGDTYAVQAVHYVQGTSDYLSGTTEAAYLASLNTLVADIQTDLKAESGQSKRIPVIVAQTANHRSAAADDVPDIALAQLACHESNANLYLATPMYHLPYQDLYHLTGEGSRWLGAHMGLAYKRIVIDGEDWEPVRPTSDVVAGSNWDVTFAVRTGLALEWDTTTVSAQTDYGFTLVDSGDSPLTVSSVTITGDNTVRVTAASTIPAGAKLRYAWQGNANQGLGNLRDNQGDTIVFDPSGTNKPLHNWSVIFELEN